MKKVLALMLTVSMLFALAACGSQPAQSSAPVSSKPANSAPEATPTLQPRGIFPQKGGGPGKGHPLAAVHRNKIAYKYPQSSLYSSAYPGKPHLDFRDIAYSKHLLVYADEPMGTSLSLKKG